MAKYQLAKSKKAWKKDIKCVSFIFMDKKNYTSPEIKELGLAKDIIKDVLLGGTGDSFPGTEEILAST